MSKYKIIYHHLGQTISIIGDITQKEVLTNKQIIEEIKRLKSTYHAEKVLFYGKLKPGKYDILGEELIVTESGNILDKNDQNRINANKLLYAILKTQEEFQEMEFILPQTKDMLMSLVDLKFSNFPNQHPATKNHSARNVANDILPYNLAARGAKPKEKTKEKALNIGNGIINYLNLYDHNDTFGGPIIIGRGYLEQLVTEDYNNIDSLRSNNILGIIGEIYDNTQKVINEYSDENINSIINKGTPNALIWIDNHPTYQFKENTIFFPEVVLINACVKMGEKNIKSLFECTLEELKQHTIKIRKNYLLDQNSQSQNDRIYWDESNNLSENQRKSR